MNASLSLVDIATIVIIINYILNIHFCFAQCLSEKSAQCFHVHTTEVFFPFETKC